VTLRDRINQLEDRERRLLGVFVVVFGVFIILVIPLGLTAYLGSISSENDSMREALTNLQQSKGTLEKRAEEQARMDRRYERKAPPLASFLAGIAQRHKIEIPETQDQAEVPHGKRFTERSTKITLRDVGMLKLAEFMQGVAQSGFPVSISRINIRKKASPPDSYNIQLVVSAYDRKAAEEKPEAAEGAEGTDAESDEADKSDKDEEAAQEDEE
jgi:general secretion pathway protein M